MAGSGSHRTNMLSPDVRAFFQISSERDRISIESLRLASDPCQAESSLGSQLTRPAPFSCIWSEPWYACSRGDGRYPVRRAAMDEMKRGFAKTTPGRKRRVGSEKRNRTFPIVGIGASAGGVEAVRHLLGQLPVETGTGEVFG